MMQSEVEASSRILEDNPMHPGDVTKRVATGEIIKSFYKVRLIRSTSSAEDYSLSPTGFMPDTYKFLLTLKPIPENSSFELKGLLYRAGKVEPLMFHDRIYGYRSPLSVKNS